MLAENNILKNIKSGDKHLPVDPSHTSQVGEKVEQGVVDVHKGLRDLASEWEDNQERGDKNKLPKGDR